MKNNLHSSHCKNTTQHFHSIRGPHKRDESVQGGNRPLWELTRLRRTGGKLRTKRGTIRRSGWFETFKRPRFYTVLETLKVLVLARAFFSVSVDFFKHHRPFKHFKTSKQHLDLDHLKTLLHVSFPSLLQKFPLEITDSKSKKQNNSVARESTHIIQICIPKLLHFAQVPHLTTEKRRQSYSGSLLFAD